VVKLKRSATQEVVKLWRAFNSRGAESQEVLLVLLKERVSRGWSSRKMLWRAFNSRGAESQEVLLVLLKERVSRGWSSVVTASLKRPLRPIVGLKLSLPMR
jgi:hypothetical protein